MLHTAPPEKAILVPAGQGVHAVSPGTAAKLLDSERETGPTAPTRADEDNSDKLELAHGGSTGSHQEAEEA